MDPATNSLTADQRFIRKGAGEQFEFVLSFCVLPFHFAKDHILYKQKNMLTVLGRKTGVGMNQVG